MYLVYHETILKSKKSTSLLYRDGVKMFEEELIYPLRPFLQNPKQFGVVHMSEPGPYIVHVPRRINTGLSHSITILLQLPHLWIIPGEHLPKNLKIYFDKLK